MKRELIYDVGMNDGSDTGFYLSQGHRVVSIDADPSLAEAARRRFRDEIAAGRLEVVNVGIADTEGSVDFWICEEKPEFNSFHKGIATRDGYSAHAIKIPTTRFASILERFGVPFYLKIDIEGNDLLCVRDLAPGRLPTYLSVESECPSEAAAASPDEGIEVLARLEEAGYSRFKLIDQRTFCGLSRPPSLRYRLDASARRWLREGPLRRVRGSWWLASRLMERTRLERRFGRELPMGCSGAWGEETAGAWLSFAEAREAYAYYRARHFENSSLAFHSFWCDWHAKV